MSPGRGEKNRAPPENYSGAKGQVLEKGKEDVGRDNHAGLLAFP